MVSAQDMGGYYRVPPDLRDLNYGKFVEQGEVKISEAMEYNSHNTTQLDMLGMQALLMKLRFMQATLNGEHLESEE
jgi:UDP-N-acetylglucosamine 4,6-dehydratase/5-epimerase